MPHIDTNDSQEKDFFSTTSLIDSAEEIEIRRSSQVFPTYIYILQQKIFLNKLDFFFVTYDAIVIYSFEKIGWP